jgi:hypothetical protein
MTSPIAETDPEAAAQQLEQLLARSIGPMAKIVVARARKRAADDEALLKKLGDAIDDAGERAAFVAGATPIFDRLRRGGVTLLGSVVSPASAPESRADDLPAIAAVPREEDVMKPGAIFLSYARDNLEVAKSIAGALRAAGLQVWLDLGKLQPGDAWDLKIRRNIEACSFFMPLISRETEARREGYFRREWNIAADRALNFADDEAFLLPVTVDDTAAYSARVPERFRAAHWTALNDGQPTPEFVEHLKGLVEEYRRRHGG